MGPIRNFVLKNFSYQRSPPGSIAVRFFYDFVSVVIINMLLKELLFGIILTTFKGLRKKMTQSDYDKNSKCFICGADKNQLEKHKVDFHLHRKTDHNIWNYINYILRLKFSDPQDLNAINSYVLDKIEKKYTSWIPQYTNKKTIKIIEEISEEDLNFDVDKYNEIHNKLPINKN